MENGNNTNPNNPYSNGYQPTGNYNNGTGNDGNNYNNVMTDYNYETNSYDSNNYGNVDYNNYSNNMGNMNTGMNNYNLNGYGNGSPAKKSKGSKGPIIAVIAIVVLLVCGVAAWFIIRNNSEATNEPLDVAKAYAKAFVEYDTDGVMETVIQNVVDRDEICDTFDDFFEGAESYGMEFDADSEDFEVLSEYSDEEIDDFLDEIEGGLTNKADIKEMCDVEYSVDYYMDVYGSTYTGTLIQTLTMARDGNTWYLIDVAMNDFDPTLVEDGDTDTTEDSTEEDSDTESDTEEASDDDTESDGGTSYSVIDEETGQELFTLVNYNDEKIYSFIEPDGWVVDKDYIDDTVNNADSLFFLDNEEIGDYMTISCSVDYGIVYYYDEASGDAEAAARYSIEETGYTTNYNPYGYDIFKYTYDYDDSQYYYIALLYVEEDNSMVIELPVCEEFDTVEEVEAFLSDNF